MQYYIQEINRKTNNLKDYENCPEIFFELNVLLENLEQIELGIDKISYQPGIFRRAFRSELDGSLQPYKIQVPNNYDKSKKYPLLVFLHGSGRTDENMFNIYHQYLSEGNFIQIAPRARGVSHYYGTENAQFDIKEVIQNTMENYTIDTSNIILAGFSMGGYGVYRTFIEAPQRFKGLAIFSGEPKVGIFRKSKNGNYPNFLKKKNLIKLRDVRKSYSTTFSSNMTGGILIPRARRTRLFSSVISVLMTTRFLKALIVTALILSR
jgi:pimeloyl-ACP methyl ester carboxylesterase